MEKALELIIKDIVNCRFNIEDDLCGKNRCHTKKRDKCYDCIKQYYLKKAK